MNIYDTVAALPRHHRLALCAWILRGVKPGYDEKRRLLGRVPRIDRKWESAKMTVKEHTAWTSKYSKQRSVMRYQIYLTWWGHAIVRHERGLPTQRVAVFDDARTATAVMNDLNKEANRG